MLDAWARRRSDTVQQKEGSIICLEERSCAGPYTLNGTVNILIKKDTEIIPATRKSMEPFTRNKSIARKENNKTDERGEAVKKHQLRLND